MIALDAFLVSSLGYYDSAIKVDHDLQIVQPSANVYFKDSGDEVIIPAYFINRGNQSEIILEVKLMSEADNGKRPQVNGSGLFLKSYNGHILKPGEILQFDFDVSEVLNQENKQHLYASIEFINAEGESAWKNFLLGKNDPKGIKEANKETLKTAKFNHIFRTKASTENLF